VFGIARGIATSIGFGTVSGISTGIACGIAIGTGFGIAIGIVYEWASESLTVWICCSAAGGLSSTAPALRGRGGLCVHGDPTETSEYHGVIWQSDMGSGA